MSVVIDCSVTIKWLFEDEADIATARLLGSLESEVLVVPSIWPHEVANVLLVSERRGRIGPQDSAEFIEMLRAFTIEIDHPGFERGLRVATDLARDHRLSSYDASYLELAMRMGFPMATLDNALIAAAKVVGVPVLPA
jgi:predicted nucleic acid-binding protein